MSAHQVSCSSQPITTKGMGWHFFSPLKKWDCKKSRISAPIPGHASKRQKLLDEMHALLAAQPTRPDPSPCSTPQTISLILQPAGLSEDAQNAPDAGPVMHDGIVAPVN
ncbi:hypothetical protein SCLCIDRAFT_142981 [Scleroderma citrinum Foug A]|uniref:Uncharacterized protein n=1 Tax=Scleroderma citrinum Foug A TaxID=1036808 RepID=A0A0C3D5C9_9AGAM|nr:hypothetical protein SCLCIDRAFT_142981 [Scleroderma citrinum Foug A]